MSEIKHSTKDNKLWLSLLVGSTIGGLISLFFFDPTLIPSGVSSLFLTLLIYLFEVSIGAVPGAIIASIFSSILHKSNIWLRLICIAIVTIIVVLFIRLDKVVLYANDVIMTMKGNKLDISGWSQVNYELPNGESPSHIVITPDGKAWFASSGIHMWDNDGWVTYTAQNSDLINNSITALAVDPTGRIWIGTTEGVSIFDGENWLNYTAENSGLTEFGTNSQTVKQIIFSKDGDAWISTGNGGVTYFTGQDWTTYWFDGNQWTKRYQGLRDFYENMAVDGQGQVWIGMKLGGLSMFDGKAWHLIGEDKEIPPGSSYFQIKINDIVVDNEGHIWIGSYEEISSFDGASWTNYGDTLPAKSRRVEHLAVAPDGKIWVLISKYPPGNELYALESDGVWTSYSKLLADEHEYIDNFFIDQQNRFWFDDYYFEPPSQ